MSLYCRGKKEKGEREREKKERRAGKKGKKQKEEDVGTRLCCLDCAEGGGGRRRKKGRFGGSVHRTAVPCATAPYEKERKGGGPLSLL